MTFMTPQANPPPDIEVETARQKTALLYRNAGVAQWVNIVNGSMLAYVNTTLHVSVGVALVWWCLIVSIAIGRYQLARSFRIAAPDAAEATTWRIRYIGATALAGAAWGAGALFFMWHAPSVVYLFTGIVLSGMVAGAIPILAPVPAAYRAFAFPVLVPMAAVILLQANSALDWAFGLMTILFMVIVLMGARYLHETLDAALRLGLEKGLLAERLKQARDVAVDALAERKLAEEQVARLLQEQQGILDNTIVNVAKVRNRAVIWASQGYAKMFGYSPGELDGVSSRQLYVNEADYESLGAKAYSIIQAGGQFRDEARFLRKDGRIIWADTSAVMLDKEKGESLWGFFDITDRKRADEAIRQNETRLRYMLETSPIAVRIASASGRKVLFANQRYAELIETPAEDVIGVDPKTYYAHPVDYDDILASLSLGEKVTNKLVELLIPGGKVKWALASYLRLEYGNEMSVLGWFYDITERTLMESALRDSEARLTAAQEIAHLGSWSLDLESGKLIWSNEIFRLFEIDPSQFGATYEAFIKAIHPDDRAAVNKAYSESLETREPYEIIHRLRMADGRIKWVQERCTTEFDPAGKPLRSTGTIQDVTERKQVEEQLRISATAFDSQEGIVITDADGVVLRINQAFTDTTGYSADEIVGKTTRMLKSERHDPDFFRAMWDSIRLTGGWQGEIWDRRKNGEEYPKWLTITAVKNEEGLVTHYVGTHFDISERKEAEEKINELAFFDQLTGLPNRTLLLDRLKQTLVGSARSASYGALLFIDLDNFKTLNDTLGHDIGDLLLIQVAQRLTASVREGDTVARFGGDEFVVVLAGCGADEGDAAAGSEMVAKKILAALNQRYLLGGVVHHSSASVGVTLFRGDHAVMDDLMKQADMAMYRAKAAGRNLIRFFDPTLESAVKERMTLEEDLRRALDERQLLLHYQAQVTGSGQIMGAEALIRWQHPLRGMVPPVEFIPLSEESGLILHLGRWVLEAACAQLAAWSGQAAMAHLTVSVNVSARQFHQPDFVDQVLAVIKNSGANPARLKLELTESLLIENIEDVIVKMSALQKIGIGFSLDDFGTGYSSLSYLSRLPLDQLKIDRSFVMNIDAGDNAVAICAATISLAHSLNLKVVAEGVETEAQRFLLSSVHRCDLFQGYLFSRPLPVEGFEDLVNRGTAS